MLSKTEFTLPKLPKLFISLDVDLDYPKLDEIIEISASNPDLGIKLHSLLDQILFNKRFDILDKIKLLKIPIWYDAKLADIPSTVFKRVQNLAPHFDYLTLQLEAIGKNGTKEGVRARDEFFKNNGSYLNLVGVTVLTSKSQEEYNFHLGLTKNQVVKDLSEIAMQTGLDALVASAQEASLIKKIIKKYDSKIKIITPGIHPLWAISNNTQTRVTTPSQAIKNGSDCLVVGTAIIKSQRPIKAINKILEEIKQAE